MLVEIDSVIAERARIFYGPRAILKVQDDGTLILGPNGLFDGDGHPPLTDDQMETARIFCAGLEELDNPQKLLPYFNEALATNLQRLAQNPLRSLSEMQIFVASWQNAANAVARSRGNAQGLDEAIQGEFSEGINLVAGNLTTNDPEATIRSPQTYTYHPHLRIHGLEREAPKATVKTPDWAIEAAQRWFGVAKQVIGMAGAPKGN